MISVMYLTIKCTAADIFKSGQVHLLILHDRNLYDITHETLYNEDFIQCAQYHMHPVQHNVLEINVSISNIKLNLKFACFI